MAFDWQIFSWLLLWRLRGCQNVLRGCRNVLRGCRTSFIGNSFSMNFSYPVYIPLTQSSSSLLNYPFEKWMHTYQVLSLRLLGLSFSHFFYEFAPVFILFHFCWFLSKWVRKHGEPPKEAKLADNKFVSVTAGCLTSKDELLIMKFSSIPACESYHPAEQYITEL